MLFNRLFSLFSTDMGIDLGTCNTLVCVRGRGIVVNEPSVVAVYKGTNTVVTGPDGQQAVGSVAKEMLGKTPGSITAIRPMKDGVIADFEVVEAMLKYFIGRVHGRGMFSHPRLVIAVPSGITAVERKAVFISSQRAGAGETHLIKEPMAAGIGAGLPISEPTANMIVDIGGGTTEIAVMSLGDIACCESLRVAGDDLDDSISAYLKRTYNLQIGEQMSERIKMEIGSAAPLAQELKMEVRGRDMISGLPRKTIITSEEVREALKEPIGQVIDAVVRVLERAEPELAADLVDNGIHLAGGGALLRGLPAVLSAATGLKCQIVDDPLTCVARGTAIYLENYSTWRHLMEANDEDS